MSSKIKSVGLNITKAKIKAGNETMRAFQSASFRMRFRIAMKILFPPKNIKLTIKHRRS